MCWKRDAWSEHSEEDIGLGKALKRPSKKFQVGFSTIWQLWKLFVQSVIPGDTVSRGRSAADVLHLSRLYRCVDSDQSERLCKCRYLCAYQCRETSHVRSVDVPGRSRIVAWQEWLLPLELIFWAKWAHKQVHQMLLYIEAFLPDKIYIKVFKAKAWPGQEEEKRDRPDLYPIKGWIFATIYRCSAVSYPWQRQSSRNKHSEYIDGVCSSGSLSSWLEFSITVTISMYVLYINRRRFGNFKLNLPQNLNLIQIFTHPFSDPLGPTTSYLGRAIKGLNE